MKNPRFCVVSSWVSITIHSKIYEKVPCTFWNIKSWCMLLVCWFTYINCYLIYTKSCIVAIQHIRFITTTIGSIKQRYSPIHHTSIQHWWRTLARRVTMALYLRELKYIKCRLPIDNTLTYMITWKKRRKMARNDMKLPETTENRLNLPQTSIYASTWWTHYHPE